MRWAPGTSSGNDTAWRAFGFYFLILGAAFVVVGYAKKLRIRHTAAQSTLYASVGLIGISVLALAPWVILDLFNPLDELYFRIVAALYCYRYRLHDRYHYARYRLGSRP